MALLVALVLASTTSTNEICPPFQLDELQPGAGEVYTFDTWHNGATQPGRVRFEVERSRPGEIRAGISVLAAGQWTPPSPRRLVAGFVMHNEDMFGGFGDRQVIVRGIDSEILRRSLAVDEELRFPVIETATQPSGEVSRHSGEYIVRHVGCGELLRDNTSIQTRRINVRLSRFIGQPGANWQLVQRSHTYDVPIGASFWYSQASGDDNPMHQGALMEGYTVP
jgi:hypothetical protein